MKYTESDDIIRIIKICRKRDAECNDTEFDTSFHIRPGKLAGYPRQEYGQACKIRFSRCKKIAKYFSPFYLQYFPYEIKCMVEYHADNCQSPEFIQQMHSPFFLFSLVRHRQQLLEYKIFPVAHFC